MLWLIFFYLTNGGKASFFFFSIFYGYRALFAANFKMSTQFVLSYYLSRNCHSLEDIFYTHVGQLTFTPKIFLSQWIALHVNFISRKHFSYFKAMEKPSKAKMTIALPVNFISRKLVSYFKPTKTFLKEKVTLHSILCYLLNNPKCQKTPKFSNQDNCIFS